MAFFVCFVAIASAFLLGQLPQSIAQQCPVGMQPLANSPPCLNDYGCSLVAKGYKCYRGTCCTVSSAGGTVSPVCRRWNERAEMENGYPKNCLYKPCSTNYMCEFSYTYNGGQYICCGKPLIPVTTASPPQIYGVIQIYPNTGTPLQCHTPNSCLAFQDTPNCVYSSRFGTRVCCSTLNC